MAMVSEAEQRFLEAAANDLQAMLGISGDVESLSFDVTGSTVTLTALVAVGSKSIELVGSGEDMVDAYRILTRHGSAEEFLAVAFRQVLEL